MSDTLTTILPLLKEHYGDHKSVIFDSKEISPILACFEAKADDDGGGRTFIFPVTSNGPSVASGTFATSQAKSEATTAGGQAANDRWVIPAATIHNFCTFSRDTLDSVRGKSAKEQFNALDHVYKMAITDQRNQLGRMAVEAGWGRVGTVTSASTVTLTIPTGFVNRVDIGTELQCSESESGHVFRNSGTVSRVTAINPDTGALTMSTDVAAASWTAADVVFRSGDRENSATPTRLWGAGVRGWLDTAALGGITRTGNPRLTGYSVSASGLDHVGALLRASRVQFNAGNTGEQTCFMSSFDYEVLMSNKDVQKNVGIELGPYKIGFDAAGVYGPQGKYTKVVCDGNLPQGEAYMGPFNDPEFRPMLKYSRSLIATDDHDGQDFLRLAASAAYQMRLYSRVAMAIPGPGKYCKITSLPSS